ncbi:MFS transporter [Methylovirgula sp. 4M-Z18]|uniref:MFS transporter n=1 Tax=Methylovirgula sp. 4M-Z18 TaxID=2293567 RepID=UPI000E2F42B4|nr:MFS transporter [Methylovirgula sp. 4M-Z18]RFB81235.1 MFS transporter [Methylovirgula sp. 4M-Z18]
MTSPHYRWVIVLAGGLLGCIAIGAMFALPVFLVPMTAATGWSRAGISSAMTIGFLAMAVGSLFWGAVTDRFGPRMVVLTGSCLMVVSLVLASYSQSLLEFQLVFGLLVGLAASAIFAPMMAAVTGWFETQRSLAVSLVSAGMGMAPMTMSPIASWLVQRHDWRTSYLIIAAIVATIMIPVSLLVRRAPALEQAVGASAAQAQGEPDMPLSEALRSPPFLILLLTNFSCCATHSGPIFHTVSYAMACGIPAMTAVSIYSVEGLAGLGGRIGFGLVGDRFGAKRTLVIGLLIQAIGALGYYFAHNIAAFYSAATLFGFTYAGVMPLYAVLARENFPLRMMGTIIGGSAMAGSLGMSTGPLLGGWIFDATGNYGWLYIASFGVGVGAFLIAMTFKPFPKDQMGALSPAARLPS